MESTALNAKHPQDDPRLIRQAQRGDRQAFAALVRRYEKRVMAVAYRTVGDSDLARDIAQEVFIKVWHALPQFKRGRPFFTWLYRIVINASFDALRREKRFQACPLDHAPEQMTRDRQAMDPAEHSDLKRVIDGLINRLSHPQRTALMLKEVEGLNAREIASVMHCPHGTVRSHLSHARAQLREWIETEYPEWTEEVKR